MIVVTHELDKPSPSKLCHIPRYAWCRTVCVGPKPVPFCDIVRRRCLRRSQHTLAGSLYMVLYYMSYVSCKPRNPRRDPGTKWHTPYTQDLTSAPGWQNRQGHNKSPATLQGMNFVAKTPAHCGFLSKHSYTVVTWLEGFDAARLIRRGDTGSCYVFGKTCQPQGTRKPCQQSFACIRSTFPSAPEPWISSCPNHSNVNVKLLELNTLNFKLIRPQPSAQTLSPTP